MELKLDRQKELGLKIPKSAMILGCGGIGFFVASGLSASGVSRITLIDGDPIDLTNLNRTFYPNADIGTNKAIALKNILKSMSPDDNISAIPLMADTDTVDTYWSDEVVIDCTDDYEFQKAICDWCKLKQIRYIRAGCKSNHITVTSSVPDWSIGPKERVQCGVHIASWIVPCMKVAQYTIDKTIRNYDLEISEEI